jgi:CheY-like chemotaxis protein
MYPAQHAADQPFTVLVVDDNDDLLYAVRTALELLGNFHVLTAKDGIEGLERATNNHPNCVVIDIRMPGLDGNQLVRALRGDRITAEIPLIILSALVQEKDQLIGLFSGADQYMHCIWTCPGHSRRRHQAARRLAWR